MNHAQAEQFNFDQPLSDYQIANHPLGHRDHASRTELREPARSYQITAPRMIRSVVAEAGLGGFVYLKGISGRRYVFSAIHPEQVSLYDHALFAVSSVDDNSVRVLENLEGLCERDHLIYVHILDDGAMAAREVLADLNEPH